MPDTPLQYRETDAPIPLLPPPEPRPSDHPPAADPAKDASPPRQTASHLFTLICALFCILAVTAAGINLILLGGRTSPADLLLRLANNAFLGCAVLQTAENPAEPPVPPAGDTNAPAEPPADPTSPETAAPETAAPVPDADPVRFPVAEADLSCESVHALFNETEYTPDTAALLAAPLAFPGYEAFRAQYGEEAPYILILHTHGTEGFLPEGADTYTMSDPFRTSDTAQNAVAVGAVMAETFRAAGIPVIHDTEMYDLTSYQDSYSRAAAAIRRHLKENPTVRIVLDVHRDSVIRADMTKIRPTVTVDGVKAAQFMIVTGTDFKGADHPDWTENLSFALKIQNSLLTNVPGFARAVNLRGAGFNQQYTAGSLLLEVGSCGNTLTEAKRAGVLAAIAIADTVTEGGCRLTLSDILPDGQEKSSASVSARLSKIISGRSAGSAAATSSSVLSPVSTSAAVMP